MFPRKTRVRSRLRCSPVNAGASAERHARHSRPSWAGGSLDRIIAAADYILGRVNDRTRIGPGHGEVIDRATVVEHRRMLVTVRDRLVAAAKAGKTLEQVQAEHPAAEFESVLGGPRRAGHFVRVAWYGVARH